jgi:glycerol uptake facilitator-like aquaporin
VALGLSSVAYAAGDETGKIEVGFMFYGADGNVFFNLTGTHTNPACSIAERWAFNTTTAIGKNMYATFLAAYMAGKEIRVIGDGTCTHGNTETVSNLFVN